MYNNILLNKVKLSYTFAPFLTQISTKIWHVIHQWTQQDLGFFVIWNLLHKIFSIKSSFFSRPFSRKTKPVLKKRIILPYYALSQLSNEGLLVLRGQKLWQFCVGPSHLHRINKRTLVQINDFLFFWENYWTLIYRFDLCALFTPFQI